MVEKLEIMLSKDHFHQDNSMISDFWRRFKVQPTVYVVSTKLMDSGTVGLDLNNSELRQLGIEDLSAKNKTLLIETRQSVLFFWDN